MAVALGLIACNNRDSIVAYVPYEPRVAVEGWIESGRPAQVMLSWSAPFDRDLDSTLLDYAIRSAKVTVSDGEQVETLTLGTDWSHIPPFVYYGSAMLGQAGKSYKLTVLYRNDTITSETHIPQPVPLSRLWFAKVNADDTTAYLHVSFRNTSSEFYQLATMVKSKEPIYTPCLYGTLSSAQLPRDSLISLQLSKGPILYPEENLNTYFMAGDTVFVKLKTLPKHGYDFWISWQNEIINGQNPIFPANTSLKSNISGGVGIWCGYGTYTYALVAP